MFEFVWPWIWLLLPLPLIVWWLAERKRQKQALRAPLFLYWRSIQEQQGKSTKRFPWLTFLIWVLVITALARPQWVGDTMDLPATGRDLMISIDISGSMEMPDMVIDDKEVDRLVAVKALLTDFIARRKGDRVGMILFGEQAYLQTPLTFDLKTVQTMLDETTIGLAGSSRTAIGDGIGLAVKRLRERDANNRVLILLTDGQNNTGVLNPLQAAELAEHAGITIYTIGVGADEMIVKNRFFGNRRINPSLELDEESLIAVAEKTGGRYFRARDTKEMEEIYQIIDELEPVEDDYQSYRPIKALFYIPLALALLISLLSILIRTLISWRMNSNTITQTKTADAHQEETHV
ncbi:vWA domain-containing protein [Kangiella sp.]|uniref:vWA domain-containing protein n=1 Tax=Kangiella sp. TaxID=1920245 RepID=UPI003A9402A3